MRIVHLCLTGPFSDGWNYQENLLSKYHAKLGYEIMIIASQWTWNRQGKVAFEDKSDYINADNVKIYRIPIKGKHHIDYRFRKFIGLKQKLDELHPDILFIHDVQFRDTTVVANYLKSSPKVIAYADNHSDFTNSGTNWLSKNILHKIIWRYYANKLVPYVRKFYGVLPARVKFLVDVYQLPESKCELLVMGADDESVKRAQRPKIKEYVRKEYKIHDDDFLIVTGGKINQYRPEVLSLMRAVTSLKNSKIKLMIFGSVSDELKSQFDNLIVNSNIIYVGWIDSEKTYECLSTADLVIFPGMHSVMWEQAVALGKPCIFRHISGFEHVDLGGNALLVDDVSCKALQEVVLKVINDKKYYNNMLSVAEEKGMAAFSYQEIAKKSIEYVEEQ